MRAVMAFFRLTISGRGIALIITLFDLIQSGLGQSARPDFSGAWNSTGNGPSVKTIVEIKQTETTIAIRHIITGSSATVLALYPTNGTVVKTKGRNHVENTGYWQGRKLILETTGPGNAP